MDTLQGICTVLSGIQSASRRSPALLIKLINADENGLK